MNAKTKSKSKRPKPASFKDDSTAHQSLTASADDRVQNLLMSFDQLGLLNDHQRQVMRGFGLNCYLMALNDSLAYQT